MVLTTILKAKCLTKKENGNDINQQLIKRSLVINGGRVNADGALHQKPYLCEIKEDSAVESLRSRQCLEPDG